MSKDDINSFPIAENCSDLVEMPDEVLDDFFNGELDWDEWVGANYPGSEHPATREALTYALAYLRGLGDAWGMTVREVWDEYLHAKESL